MYKPMFRVPATVLVLVSLLILASCGGGGSAPTNQENFEERASEAVLAIVEGIWIVDYRLISDTCGLDTDSEGSVRRFQIEVDQAGSEVLIDGLIPGEVTEDGFFARGPGPVSNCPDGSTATSVMTSALSDLDGDNAESLFFVQVPCPSGVCERTREGSATRVQ